MSVQFFEARCLNQSNKKLFGLCDDPSPASNPAYIDETNGAKWIAIIDNEPRFNVQFIAIDNCIEMLRADGKMDKRCDGMLVYNDSVCFVELKERATKGPGWIKDAEEQLRSTIGYFEKESVSTTFKSKKAYIANSENPKFKTNQARRMDQFYMDTNYVLRIENRIIL